MKAKILVVDDEEAARVSLAEILRLEGYDVVSAESGLDAIQFLKAESIDLMLLDIRMPGIDGIEVLQEANKVSPDTEVILLTAHGSMETAIDALREGAHDYLTKPSSPNEILSSVAMGLSRRTENQKRKLIIDQLETSLQQLRDVEGVEDDHQASRSVVTLPEGVPADLVRRELWRGNKKVTLTPTEGKLLKVLIDNKGRVLSHKELVFLVQGYDVNDYEAPEVLRPLVSRLRKKLSEFPDGESWVVNVRGTGYVLDTEGK
jgi:DNA-binding response OmpR family regulator